VNILDGCRRSENKTYGTQQYGITALAARKENAYVQKANL
jgi:hypothetical protein